MIFLPPPSSASFLLFSRRRRPTDRRYAHSSDPACESCVGRPVGHSVTAHGRGGTHEPASHLRGRAASHSSSSLSKLRTSPTFDSRPHPVPFPSSLSYLTSVLYPRGDRHNNDEPGQAALETNNATIRPTTTVTIMQHDTTGLSLFSAFSKFPPRPHGDW